MLRNQLLLILVCLGMAAVARAVQPDCDASAGVCQQKPDNPPSLEPSRPMSRTPDPEASALAPMPLPGNDALLKARPDGSHALTQNHDNDLFVSPPQQAIHTDPFGPEATRPLRVAPEKQ